VTRLSDLGIDLAQLSAGQLAALYEAAELFPVDHPGFLEAAARITGQESLRPTSEQRERQERADERYREACLDVWSEGVTLDAELRRRAMVGAWSRTPSQTSFGDVRWTRPSVEPPMMWLLFALLEREFDWGGNDDRSDS
jgi:hypothetical protein